MTGFLILILVIPFLGAAMFFVRAQREQKARLRLERELAALAALRERADEAQTEWYAVLAHELRSPIGALLGYHELLSDGNYGELPASARAALDAIRAASTQLEAIVDGIDACAPPEGSTPDDWETVDPVALLTDTAEALRADAEARQARIEIDAQGTASFLTRPDALGPALFLALSAALKASPGVTLRCGIVAEAGAGAGTGGAAGGGATAGGVTHFHIRGTRLDPLEDDPRRVTETTHAGHEPLTGPGMRIELARRLALRFGGDVRLSADPDGAVLTLTVPHRPAL